jgi:hypothetical protein
MGIGSLTEGVSYLPASTCNLDINKTQGTCATSTIHGKSAQLYGGFIKFTIIPLKNGDPFAFDFELVDGPDIHLAGSAHGITEASNVVLEPQQ